MATLERYLEALVTLKTKAQEDSLNPPDSKKNEFGYGFVCGVQAGLRMAEELLNKQLNEEEEDDGTIPRSKKANRTR